MGDTAGLPEVYVRVLLPTALLLHKSHSSAQRAAVTEQVSPPSQDPQHSLLSTKQSPSAPRGANKPWHLNYPHHSPDADPPGFPTETTLARHQSHQICSELKLSPCEPYRRK